MNKVTVFGGYSKMKNHKGNIHGVYPNKYEFTKRSIVYLYLATGVPFQICQFEPTHDKFKTVGITNICASAGVEINTTAGGNPTHPSERTETL